MEKAENKMKKSIVKSSKQTPNISEIIRNKRFGYRAEVDLERKRPRNPNEERQLKQWEKDRGGIKIGKI